MEDPRTFLKPGEQVEVMIIDNDKEERKIGLSIKAIKKAEKGMDYRAYLAEQNNQGKKGAQKPGSQSMGTLGDALKGKFPSGSSEE